MMSKLQAFENKYGVVNSVINGKLQYRAQDRTFLGRLLNLDINSNLIKVLEFAIVAHGTQTRKDSDVPYWVHVATVAINAFKSDTKNDVAFCIGCLHDVPEDCFHSDGTPYTLVDIFNFMKPIFDKQFVKDVLIGVDNLTEKYTSVDYPFLNRKERKALELKKYATIRYVDALVKQEDIQDNFCGNAGYYYSVGKFPKSWTLEAIHKMEVLEPILGSKFDSELSNKMEIFVYPIYVAEV